MSNYDRILSEFKKIGYNPESYLRDTAEAYRVLNDISAHNAGMSSFDKDIAE